MAKGRNPQQLYQIWLDQDLVKELRPMAAQNNLSMGSLCTMLILQGIASLREQLRAAVVNDGSEESREQVRDPQPQDGEAAQQALVAEGSPQAAPADSVLQAP